MKLPTYDRLSRDQANALKIPLDDSCLITGPPGSGKTVIAIHRANEASQAGKATRMLMFFRVLAGYTQDAADHGDNIEINGEQKTFNSWFWSLYWKVFKHGPPTMPDDKWKVDWQAVLMDAQQLTEGQKSDANLDLIIDEGQDIPKLFYLFATDFGSTTTIFADQNQGITDDPTSIQDIQETTGIGPERTMTLTHNFRNTFETARLASYIGKRTFTAESNQIDTADLENLAKGNMPELYRQPIEEMIPRMLRMAANQSESHIGIFTDKLALQKKIFTQLSAQKAADPEYKNVKIQYYDSSEYYNRLKKSRRNGSSSVPAVETDINWQEPGIKLVNFISAKGLEFDTVFIPELQDLLTIHSDPENTLSARLFYVAVTRARLQLILSYGGSGEPAIMSLFPKEYLTIMDPS